MPHVHIKTIESRKVVCQACPFYKKESNVCGVDRQIINMKVFLNNCPENKWPLEEYVEPPPTPKKKPKEPPIHVKIGTFSKSIYRWARAGFLKTSKKQLNQRMEICRSCEFWDSSAWNGTGKCTKCGCSTWAKLRIRTEKCPIGKW
jgi:hypothetical protein